MLEAASHTNMEPDSAGLDRPFICENCPKKYLRKNNLEDHVLMDHPDTKQVGAQSVAYVPGKVVLKVDAPARLV